jgi:hypothetical protein
MPDRAERPLKHRHRRLYYRGEKTEHIVSRFLAAQRR